MLEAVVGDESGGALVAATEPAGEAATSAASRRARRGASGHGRRTRWVDQSPVTWALGYVYSMSQVSSRALARSSAALSSTATVPTDSSDLDDLDDLDEHPFSEDLPMWVCRFGPDEPGGWGRHHHRQHQLAWASEGTVIARLDEVHWVVPTSRAVWLPSGCQHDVIPRPGTTLHCLYVWPELCPITWRDPTLVTVSPLLRELLLHLTAHQDEAQVSAATATLLFGALEPVDGPQVQLPMPHDPHLRAVARDVLASPRQAHRVEHLARRHHLGASTLRRRFVIETGLTISEWRRQARLHASLGLLADGLSVEQVAFHVGYSSANGFIDAFKRHFGTTPAQYRVEGGRRPTERPA